MIEPSLQRYSIEDLVKGGEVEVPEESTPRRRRLYSSRELEALPPHEWLIEGIASKGSRVYITGDPGSGKTFLTMELLVSASRGETFGRFRIATREGYSRPLRSLYITGEGFDGIRGRWMVAREHHQLTEEEQERVAFSPDVFNLFSPSEPDLKALVEDIEAHQADIVVFDTLFLMTEGGDVKDTDTATKVAATIREIERRIGRPLIVILIAHLTKESKTLFGSIGWTAGADSIIQVNGKGDEIRTITCEKLKDGERWRPAAFELRQAHYGPMGDTLNSAYVEWTDAPVSTKTQQAMVEDMRVRTVIEYLQNHCSGVPNAMSARKISEGTDLPKDAVYKILRGMADSYRDKKSLNGVRKTDREASSKTGAASVVYYWDPAFVGGED